MDKIKNFFQKLIPSKRRIVQLYAAVLYNAHAKGFITGDIYTGKLKNACVPGLNCYSCPGAAFSCPLGALQNAIASTGHRLPFYVLGILMLYGLIFGRTICGWLCPFGLIQELLYKLPVPKIKKNRFTRLLAKLKYALLIGLVILIPLYNAFRYYPLPAFCKYICPAGTLEGAVLLLTHPENSALFSMLGALFTSKFTILVCIVILCAFAYRAFCRFLCPLGLIYGFFNKICVIGVKVNEDKCIHCNKCVRECLMDVKKVGDVECIQCGKCIPVCPTDCIDFKAGKIVLNRKETEKTKNGKHIFAAVSVLLLCAVLIAANLPAGGKETPVSDLPEATVSQAAEENSVSGQNPATPLETNPEILTGSEIGMLAPDFTAKGIGGSESFTLSDARGRVAVVNFWATWCSPCVKELPYFDAVSKECAEEAVVIAVHSDMVTDDPENYLSRFDYEMPFALDKTGDAARALGVGYMLPHTVVIAPDGRITYNRAGSLTYDEISRLIDEAAK